MKKCSENVADFLGFLRQAQEDYNIAKSMDSDMEKETQDILHRIELGENTYHEYAKLSRGLKEVRQKRREAKDKWTQLEPIVNWAAEHEETIKSIEKLLGEVRKIERFEENRYYIPKTEIVSQILGDEKKCESTDV